MRRPPLALAAALAVLPACQGIETFTAEGSAAGPDLQVAGPVEVPFMAITTGNHTVMEGEAEGSFTLDLSGSRAAGSGPLDVELDYLVDIEFYGGEQQREAELATLSDRDRVELNRPGFPWSCRYQGCLAKGLLLLDAPADSPWEVSWTVRSRVVVTSGSKDFEGGEGGIDLLFGEEIDAWFMAL